MATGLPANDDNLLRAFVGSRYLAYARAWRRMDGHGVSLSWNWAPLLFNAGWLGYRRMYGLAVLFIAVDAAESGLQVALDLPGWTGPAFSFALYLTLTLNADGWYRDFARREIATVAADAPTQADAEARAARRGRPSLFMGLAFLALRIAALIVPDLPALLRNL